MNVHAPSRPATLSHEARLDRLAEVAVKVGLGLKPGQEVIVTSPLEGLDLVRRVTEHAYRAGASLVTTIFSDEVATLMRYQHGADEGFDTATGWLFDGMATAYKNGAARLAIYGENPSLLSGQDPEKVARANRARSKAYVPALEQIVNYVTNWTILSCATPSWAPGCASAARRCWTAAPRMRRRSWAASTP